MKVIRASERASARAMEYSLKLVLVSRLLLNSNRQRGRERGRAPITHTRMQFSHFLSLYCGNRHSPALQQRAELKRQKRALAANIN